MSGLHLELEGLDTAMQSIEEFGMALRKSTDRAVQSIASQARDMVRHAFRAEGYQTIANETVLRTITDGYEVFVQGEGAKRLSFVLSGTQPHTIVARRGQALKFPWGGGIHFYRKVEHPGTRPRNPLQGVLYEIRSMAEREAQTISLED